MAKLTQEEIIAQKTAEAQAQVDAKSAEKAILARTARLRALRLARDAELADAKVPAPAPKTVPKRVRRHTPK